MLSRRGEPEARRFQPLLERADQAAVAVVLGVSLLAIAAALFLAHRQRGGLIEIDRSPPKALLFQLDINRADWPELTLLPGIGKTRAQQIVEFRQTHGPFRSADDLQRVPGIGPKTVARLKPYLLPMDPTN